MPLTETQLDEAAERIALAERDPEDIARDLCVPVTQLARALRKAGCFRDVEDVAEMNRLYRRALLDRVQVSALTSLAQIAVASPDGQDRSASEARALESIRKSCVDLLHMDRHLRPPAPRRPTAAARQRAIEAVDDDEPYILLDESGMPLRDQALRREIESIDADDDVLTPISRHERNEQRLEAQRVRAERHAVKVTKIKLIDALQRLGEANAPPTPPTSRQPEPAGTASARPGASAPAHPGRDPRAPPRAR